MKVLQYRRVRFGGGDYADDRRESSLLSHKAISSAVKELLFQLFPTLPANRTLISTWAVAWLWKQILRCWGVKCQDTYIGLPRE